MKFRNTVCSSKCNRRMAKKLTLKKLKKLKKNLRLTTLVLCRKILETQTIQKEINSMELKMYIPKQRALATIIGSPPSV